MLRPLYHFTLDKSGFEESEVNNLWYSAKPSAARNGESESENLLGYSALCYQLPIEQRK